MISWKKRIRFKVRLLEFFIYLYNNGPCTELNGSLLNICIFNMLLQYYCRYGQKKPRNIYAAKNVLLI